jgi:hypothetical protein
MGEVKHEKQLRLISYSCNFIFSLHQVTFSLRTGPVKSLTKEMYEAKLKQYDSELNGIEDKLKRADVH